MRLEVNVSLFCLKISGEHMKHVKIICVFQLVLFTLKFLEMLHLTHGSIYLLQSKRDIKLYYRFILDLWKWPLVLSYCFPWSGYTHSMVSEWTACQKLRICIQNVWAQKDHYSVMRNFSHWTTSAIDNW